MTLTPMGETLRGVLLDVDGTIVDTNQAHAEAWVRTFAEFRIRADGDHVRRLIGKGGDKLMPEVAGIDKDSERGQAISARRSQLFLEEYLPRLRAFPRARDLVARMRAQGLSVTVATSAKAEEVKAMLRVADVLDLVDIGVSSGDVEHSKPDPDVVVAALKRARLAPGEAILLGDTPYDVGAGGRAGVAVVGLRCGGWDDASLEGAIAIYDDPANLLAGYDHSPFAKDWSGRINAGDVRQTGVVRERASAEPEARA